jgi:hypothetical protein
MTLIRESRLLADRRGVALPLSLLGLLLVSVVIIGTAVTASSERALSFAHQDATQSLYMTAGALEAFVAAATQNGSLAPGSFTQTSQRGDRQVEVAVERVADVNTRFPGVPRSYFSLRAVPVGGGRAVNAMISVGPFELGLESAATFGGDSRIGGSTIVSDGRDSDQCDLDAGQSAVVHSTGTDVDTIGGRVTFLGDVVESDLTGEQLVRRALGGHSIEELVRLIHAQNLPASQYVTFGTNDIWGTSPSFPTTGSERTITSWQNRTGGGRERRGAEQPTNWYCPGSTDDQTANTCADIADIDTTTYKIVVIDARHLNGHTVTIAGDHGQALLIVLNGGIEVTGNFAFRGLMVSTNDIDISGTGNKIEGAIVSQNEVRVVRPTDSESEVTGNAVVRFNRCALENVASAIGGGGAVLVPTPTFGWTELVR